MTPDTLARTLAKAYGLIESAHTDLAQALRYLEHVQNDLEYRQ